MSFMKAVQFFFGVGGRGPVWFEAVPRTTAAIEVPPPAPRGPRPRRAAANFARGLVFRESAFSRLEAALHRDAAGPRFARETGPRDCVAGARGPKKSRFRCSRIGPLVRLSMEVSSAVIRTEPTPLIGPRLGGYRIRRALGRERGRLVYLAEQDRPRLGEP